MDQPVCLCCAEPRVWGTLLLSWTGPKAEGKAMDEDPENVIPVLSLLLISYMMGGKSLTLSANWR